jgi:anthranilate synthase component 1
VVNRKAFAVITELEFKSLSAQGYNRIPLMVEAFADLETPLSLYLKLAFTKAGGKYSFLLESVVGGERFGRYSFIGLPARTLLRAQGFGPDATTEVVTDGVVTETNHDNPLDFVASYQKRFKVALRPGLPRFCGGLAGYFGYDTVRHIEKKLLASCPPDTLGCPDILLLQCEELAVIDNLSGKLYLIVYADPAQSEAYSNTKKRLRDLKEQLKYSVSAPVVKPTQAYPAEREFAKADYLAAVERAKRLIEGGDFMQVQVGQRIRKRYTESPLSLYRALRSLNPSPYMYYYHFGDFHVVGASPEILVRQEQTDAGQKVTIRPLAGTRPRASTPERDKAVEVELVNDPKERAEHVMLIDLAQRHRPHCQDRHGPGHRGVCGGALQPCDAHREQCRGHVAGRHDQHGCVARDLPRRHTDRRAQGARDGDDRPARTQQARPVWWRLRLPELCR